jgi:hypothetical protein
MYSKKIFSILVLFVLFVISPISANAVRSVPPTTSWTYITSENYKYVVYNAPGDVNSLASFSFPIWKNPVKPVVYLVTQQPQFVGNITGKTITFTAESPSSPDATWVFGSATGTGLPPSVRFFFSTVPGYSVGDGVNTPEKYWWSNPVSAVLQPNGTYNLSVTITPDQWSNALGQVGSSVPEKFAWAMQRSVQIGMAFGGGSFFDIGLGMKIGTWANWILKTFTVQ